MCQYQLGEGGTGILESCCFQHQAVETQFSPSMGNPCLSQQPLPWEKSPEPDGQARRRIPATHISQACLHTTGHAQGGDRCMVSMHVPRRTPRDLHCRDQT